MTRMRIPYQDTTIPPEKTKGDIEALLKKAGAKAAQWTEDYSSGQPPTLQFIMEVEVKGVRRKLGFKMTPPALAQRKKIRTGRGKEFGFTVNMEASLRLMWWYLKAKLEAVQFGLESMEKEFLSSVITSLPGGGTTTIGETATELIASPSSSNILPTFKLIPPELEDKSE